MSRLFTPDALAVFLAKISEANLEIVLVGGQSINLWAVHYADQIPELDQYRPFASKDIDFYGGKAEAIECHRILGGTITLNVDFDPSPNTGVLVVPNGDQPLRVDFLGSVYGVGDVELLGSAMVFQGQDRLAGIQLPTLNPMLCLEGKLKSTVGLPQQGRQDLKHLQMSILFAKQYIKDTLMADTRKGLKLIERLLFNARGDAGLTCWDRHGVEIESAIPTVAEVDINDEKWDSFKSIRLPQIQREITKKRDAYLVTKANIAAIARQRKPKPEAER